MKIDNFLLIFLILGLIACTDKRAEAQGKLMEKDSLSNRISLKSVKDTLVKTFSVPEICFTPPVITDCVDEVVNVLTCSYPICREPVPDSIPEKPDGFICCISEEMPSFPGGEEALRQFIAENLQYTNSESCIQGRVVLRFVVDKQGYIKNVEVMRSLDPEFDKEAVRVVESMPRWNTGKSNGFAVDTYYTLPISFKISQ